MYTYIYILLLIYIYILIHNIYIYTSDFPVVKASGCEKQLQVMPRPDILDFDGFVLRRGAANRGGLRGALGVVKKSMVFLWVKTMP